ncbi:hypothetical protein ACIBK9_17155 [Nonomuraea sp. NPDC050227]|uniref:hypothetical protein n=1 Tax=Nonomuraea sp. NPDC050227 TaxID=3364360 RepID=UPI00379F085A
MLPDGWGQLREKDAWTKTFTEPRLCAAIVDRRTFNAAIIDTGTRSYRLAQSEAQHSTHS